MDLEKNMNRCKKSRVKENHETKQSGERHDIKERSEQDAVTIRRT